MCQDWGENRHRPDTVADTIIGGVAATTSALLLLIQIISWLRSALDHFSPALIK